MSELHGLSICIPTHRRPEMLVECVRSVFDNDVRPLEIVISDDAPEAGAREALAALSVPEGIDIVYVANTAQPGQSGNVRNAFRRASHGHLVLMHDDDLFAPGGLDALVAGWSAHDVDAVYGFQDVADADGTVDPVASAGNNAAYARDATSLGLQSSNLRSALLGQFPNNGFLIRRDLALEAGYPDEQEVGRVPVDYFFGIRYACVAQHLFLLISETVAVYRRSFASVVRKPAARKLTELGFDGHLGYERLEEIEPSSPLEVDALERAKARAAGAAVDGYLATGRPWRSAALLWRHGRQISFSRRWWARRLLLVAAGLVRLGPSALVSRLHQARSAGQP